MSNEINSKGNLQSPSTYEQQPQIIQINNQNQPVQILSNQPVLYQILPNQSNQFSNQPVQYELQPVQYQILNLQNPQVQYQILPNLNSQIQYNPQSQNNIYNPPVTDLSLKNLNECISVNIYNDYNYCCGREQYIVTGKTFNGTEINLFKIVESSDECNKCLNSKFSKPMNLKFYSFEDNQLLNPLIEIKEGRCYICACICQDVCIGMNDIEVKTSNNQLTRIVKREKGFCCGIVKKIYDINGNLLYFIEYDNCSCRIMIIFLLIIFSVIFLIIIAIIAVLSRGNVGGCNCCNERNVIRHVYDKYANVVGSIEIIKNCCCDCYCACCCCYSPIYCINFPISMDTNSKLSLIGTAIEMDYTNL